MKFTKTHEWARKEANNVVTVGITDFAQKEIRDIVYIELPKVGIELSQGQSAAAVESVKAAFEIYAPVSGKIVEVNEKVVGDVTLVHQQPYETGWLFKIEASNPRELDELMDQAAYEKIIKENAH